MKRTSLVAVLCWFVLAGALSPVIADDAKPLNDEATSAVLIPIAHRGLLRHAPENTLPAFATCLELGMGLRRAAQSTPS